MADYSFSPQFANLAGLQPLQAIDLTRGGALQFQPLQAIQVQSSRPELVAEGIAGAVSNIAKGALSGITARYEKKEEEEKEKRKFAHELMLYGVKEKSENKEFFEKEEARFISENSGKPGFAKKYAEFKKAYSGFSDRVPETKIKKEPADYSDVEPPLPEQQPELEAEFVTTTAEMPEERPGVFSWKPPTRMPQEKPALEALPAPQIPPQVVTTQKKQIEGVDYTKYPEPPSYGQIETDEEAQNLASELNNQLKDTNPDYEYKVINLGKADEYKTVVPVSIRGGRINEEQAIVSAQREQRKEAREEAKAELESQQLQQKIEIDAQKKKDAPAVLAKAAEDNATILKEINFILDAANKNENVLGPVGMGYGWVPTTDAKEVRNAWDTILSKMTLQSLTDLRLQSPTGGALGNVSDKDTELLKNSAGNIYINTGKPSTIKAKLLDLKRKFENIQERITNDKFWDSEQFQKPSTTWDIEQDERNKKYTQIQDQSASPTQKQSQASVPSNYVKLVSPQNKVVYAPPEKVDALIKQRGYTKAQ